VRSAALGLVSFISWILNYAVAQTSLDLFSMVGDAGAFAMCA
jgi:hypothetical protein